MNLPQLWLLLSWLTRLFCFFPHLFIYFPSNGWCFSSPEKPGLPLSPADRAVRCSLGALGGWGPPHTYWDQNQDSTEMRKSAVFLYSVLSHVTFSSQLTFLECSQSWVGTEARFSECYSYASLMRMVWLYFLPVCFIHRDSEYPLSSDRLLICFLFTSGLQPWHHLSFPWPPVLSIPCMSGQENMIFSACKAQSPALPWLTL